MKLWYKETGNEATIQQYAQLKTSAPCDVFIILFLAASYHQNMYPQLHICQTATTNITIILAKQM